MTHKQAIQEAQDSGIYKEEVLIDNIIRETQGTLITPNNITTKIKKGVVQNIGHDRNVLVIEKLGGGRLELFAGTDRIGTVYQNGTWVSYDHRASVFVPRKG